MALVKVEVRKRKPKPLKRPGRKRKVVNTESIVELSALGCTVQEIATALKISVSLIKTRFASDVREGRVKLQKSLRKAQVSSAIDRGSVPMQIWLGKQLLGQSDKSEVATHDATRQSERQALTMAEIEQFRTIMAAALGTTQAQLEAVPQVQANVGTSRSQPRLIEAELVEPEQSPN